MISIGDLEAFSSIPSSETAPTSPGVQEDPVRAEDPFRAKKHTLFTSAIIERFRC